MASASVLSKAVVVLLMNHCLLLLPLLAMDLCLVQYLCSFLFLAVDGPIVAQLEVLFSSDYM